MNGMVIHRNMSMEMPAGWALAGRLGYVGAAVRRRQKELDRVFGDGNWRVAYIWQHRCIDRSEALALYEEGYYQFLAANPEVLEWLCRTASNVYDIAPTNIESGEDYERQECDAIHLQDIAIRRCLRRLGRRFEGDRLVQIRGHESEGYRLNPGIVPFHDPDGVLRPRNVSKTWWNPGSVEDFWQSNKVLLVRCTVPQEALRKWLLRDLKKCPDGAIWIAVFGGSFNPIHFGHIRIACDLLGLYGFAKVIFVPNGTHYRKSDLIDEDHRATMIELAIAGEPRFALCRYELGRGVQVARSVDTAQHIQQETDKTNPDATLFTVRGSETIPRMLRWQSLPDLLRWPVVVPVRPYFDPWETLGDEEGYRLHHDRFLFMRREYEDGLSSTFVRARAGLGISLRGLVPAEVEKHIHDHGLYRQEGVRSNDTH